MRFRVDGKMKRAETKGIINEKDHRVQRIPSSAFTVVKDKVKNFESEVRTVMRRIFGRSNYLSKYLTLNTQHSVHKNNSTLNTQHLTLLRVALMAVLILIVVFGIVSTTFAVITLDNVSNTNSTASTISWNHTTGNGSNKILIVGCAWDGRNTNSITSVTYNGISLIQLRTDQIAGNARAQTALWYLVNPPSGTFTVSVTIGGTNTGKPNQCGAVTFFGVDQNTPFSSNNGASGTTNSPTVSIASTAGEIVVDVAAIYKPTSSPITPATGQTLLWNDSIGGTGAVNGGMSYKSGATSVVMSWNESTGGGYWAISAASLKEAIIDSTPPTEGTLSISPDDGVYTAPNFTITEDFTDNESAITSCEYTIDGGTNWAAGTVSGTGPTYTCTANVTGATGSLTIQMRATSAGGTSTPTNTLNRTVDDVPPTDGTLTASPGNAQVSLSWTAATDAESGLDPTTPYTLVYDTVGTPADCNSGTVIYQGNGTSFVHTGLTNGTTYYYRLCATDAMGNTSTGTTASATPQACQATAPTDLQATNVTSSQVDLQWTADCTNNDTYNVYRDGAQIASGLTCSAGTMTYSDTTVSPNTSYTYTVRGYNNAGTCESGDSNAVNVTTPSGPVFHITSCTDCHGQPPTEGTTRQRGPGYPSIGGGQVIGSHAAHVTSHGIACTECHIDNGTNLNHRNGVIEFQTSIRGGSYSPNDIDVDPNGFPLQDVEDGTGLGSCSNTGCHGVSSPTWGSSTGNPTCYQCHGTQANGNNAPSSTSDTPSGNANKVGAHQAHLQGLNGYTAGIQCNECHNVPTDAMSAGHLYDGVNDTTYLQAELAFGNIANGGDDGQAQMTPTYDYATQTCDVYCHNEAYFKNGWGTGTAPTWNDLTYLQGTSADCSKCHGYPPGGGHPNNTNCSMCHSHVNSTNDGFLPATDPSGGVTLHVDGIVEGGGDCLGCHMDSTQGGVRRAVRSDFQLASHHVSTGAPTDVNTCMACHGDLITDLNHPGSATADPTVQVEDADNVGTYYTIDPSTADANLATFCLSCHDANGATRLGADALKPFVSSGDTTAPPDINSAWTATYNHSAGATCNDCHGNAAGSTTDTLNPDYNLHGSSAPSILRAANQYDVCFQCHNVTINKTNLASETYMDNNFDPNKGTIYQNNWNTIPNIQSQFATTNYAYHPLLGIGRNQPADNLNADWTNSNYAKADSGCPDGTCTGLDNNFVDGWESTSLVTCTDCHEDNSGLTTAKGPHGSAQPWILKGMDTTVTVTTIGAGTIQPNSTAPVQNAYIAANFCVNCHRADIYGWGSNTTPGINGDANETFARVSHLGGAMRTKCTATDAETGQGGFRNIGCMNCHGGGEVAGIHGSNLGVGTAGADAMGKRFMNGNSWQGHTLGDTNGSQVGCYTGTPPAIGQQMSNCAKEHTGGKNVTPNYFYQWQ